MIGKVLWAGFFCRSQRRSHDNGVWVGGADGGGSGGEQGSVFGRIDGLIAPVAGQIGFVPDDVVLNVVAVALGEFSCPLRVLVRVGGGSEVVGGVAVEQGGEAEIGVGNGRYHPICLIPLKRLTIIEGCLDVLDTGLADLRQIFSQLCIVVLVEIDVDAQLRTGVGNGDGQVGRDAAGEVILAGFERAQAE